MNKIKKEVEEKIKTDYRAGYYDENEKWRCLECEEIRIDDPRIEAGMKCGHCAYGY